MCICTISQLRDVCSKCETLYDIFSKYTGNEYTSNIIKDLECDDIIWAIAEQNDIDEDSMKNWICDHFESSASCKVFQEQGPAGGWPVVEIKCLDMVFYIDWVLDY